MTYIEIINVSQKQWVETRDHMMPFYFLNGGHHYD